MKSLKKVIDILDYLSDAERDMGVTNGRCNLIEQLYLSHIIQYSFFYLNIFSLEIKEVK